MAARKQTRKKRRPPLRQVKREKLRELLAVAYADPNICSEVHIANLAAICAWVETGALPPGVKPMFRVVENKAG